MLSGTRWQVYSQCRHVTLHRPTKPNQRDECQIVLAALDPTDIAAIEPCFVGQSLLRHSELAPAGANALAEDVEIWVHPATSPGR